MTYYKIALEPVDSALADILTALLNEENFEGFEESEQTLFGYIPEDKWNETNVKEYAQQFNLNYTVEKIEQQNWNAVWESNYSPVIVDDIVAVRADFHTPITTVKHEINITPKMSFGTGHHATTWMMLKEMDNIECQGKSVFDFGTGTGVLAIFAHIKGASRIVANDIDPWSVENSKENFEKNAVTNYQMLDCELDKMPKDTFDIILANINLNILSDNCTLLYEKLNTNGNILVSGIMSGDIERVNSIYLKAGFILKNTENKDNWALIHYTKS